MQKQLQYIGFHKNMPPSNASTALQQFAQNYTLTTPYIENLFSNNNALFNGCTQYDVISEKTHIPVPTKYAMLCGYLSGKTVCNYRNTILKIHGVQWGEAHLYIDTQCSYVLNKSPEPLGSWLRNNDISVTHQFYRIPPSNTSMIIRLRLMKGFGFIINKLIKSPEECFELTVE